MKEFKEKTILTVFRINEMAMTSCFEIVVQKQTETHIIYKLPRKRKLFKIKIDSIDLLFEDRKKNLIIKSDMDGNIFRGNACVNLVSDYSKESVIKFIENNNLIELDDNQKSHLVLMSSTEASNSEFNITNINLLYPEAYTSSSLVMSIKKR